jgi:uncharacterized protein (DUF427 family)
MGLSWQQGPLAPGAVGHFLTDQPLPDRLLFAEPARRRMRIRFDDTWIADSEQAILLHEPGHYPVAYLPLEHVAEGVLLPTDRTSANRCSPGTSRSHGMRWTASTKKTNAFSDTRLSSRRLVVRAAGRTIADTTAPVVLYESGFAPRWYVPRKDVDETALTVTRASTFCPYKGIADYYSVAGIPDAAWFYRDAFPEAARIDDLVSFKPDKVDVFLDGKQLGLEPGQTVFAHGLDRGLQPDEIAHRDDSGLDSTGVQQ